VHFFLPWAFRGIAVTPQNSFCQEIQAPASITGDLQHLSPRLFSAIVT
jgi:hypothetical protein